MMFNYGANFHDNGGSGSIKSDNDSDEVTDLKFRIKLIEFRIKLIEFRIKLIEFRMKLIEFRIKLMDFKKFD